MTDGTFVIIVRGVAGPWVRAAFDDVQLTVVGDSTALRSAGTDQAALHGLLQEAGAEFQAKLGTGHGSRRT